MNNIALTLSYRGTEFHGWQKQPKDPTIQEALSDAIFAITGDRVMPIGCGRTDAGVHARDYVANFRSNTAIPLERLPLALNAKLPRDIAVTRAQQVPEDFHAVFSCTRKEYTYTMLCARIRDPFRMDQAAFIPDRLNAEAMAAAAAEFCGTHDFVSMRTLGSNVKTTVRTVYDSQISWQDVPGGRLIRYRVSANGFLYNMVRTMAGTLVYAGLGKLAPGDITRILAGGQRSQAGPVLPGCGLCMTGVWYGSDVRGVPDASFFASASYTSGAKDCIDSDQA